MTTFMHETLGWIGVVFILVAYAGNAFGFFASDAIVYLVLNVFGALGIMIDAAAQKNYQPVVLNVIWLLIAVIGIVRVFV